MKIGFGKFMFTALLATAALSVPLHVSAQNDVQQSSHFVINLGLYSDSAHADALVNEIKSQGLSAFIETKTYQGRPAQFVRVGPYPDRAAAETARMRVKQIDERLPTSIVEISGTPEPIVAAENPHQTNKYQAPSQPSVRQQLSDVRATQQAAVQVQAKTSATVATRQQQESAATTVIADAALVEQPAQDENAWTITKIVLLALAGCYVLLFIGGFNDKFVVFYDKADFFVTAMVFMSFVIGFFLSAFFNPSGENAPATLMQKLIFYASCLSAAGFGVWTMMLSIQHNRSVPLGIVIGTFKIATALLMFLAILAARPTSKRDSVVGAMNNDREWMILAIVIAAVGWIGNKLINGERVYMKRWEPTL